MADPFRLRVLKSLTDTLKGITPANGYAHDLSDFTDEAGRPASRVFRGRSLFGFNDPLPMISILEAPQSEDHLFGGPGETASAGNWKITVQAFVPDTPDNPTDPAHLLIADVIVRLAKARKEKRDLFGLGNVAPCVTDLRFGTPVVRPADDEVSTVAFAHLGLTLTLAEELENPFA